MRGQNWPRSGGPGVEKKFPFEKKPFPLFVVSKHIWWSGGAAIARITGILNVHVSVSSPSSFAAHPPFFLFAVFSFFQKSTMNSVDNIQELLGELEGLKGRAIASREDCAQSSHSLLV